MRLFTITSLALAAIFVAALRIRATSRPLAERIDALLPQTQCRQCGYHGCRPYADAIAAGIAAINRCPPGGEHVIRGLARLTGHEPRPLDPACGAFKPRQVALIEEEHCIGCTLCIKACPTDAIIGAPRLMHTVITAQCTGCELCIAPCPVDCIVLRPMPWRAIERLRGRPGAFRNEMRVRFEGRNRRLERDQREQLERLAEKNAAKLAELRHASDAAASRKRAIVEAALKRARERLAGAGLTRN